MSHPIRRSNAVIPLEIRVVPWYPRAPTACRGECQFQTAVQSRQIVPVPESPYRYRLLQKARGECHRRFDRESPCSHCGPREAQSVRLLHLLIARMPVLFELALPRRDSNTWIRLDPATPRSERARCQIEKLAPGSSGPGRRPRFRSGRDVSAELHPEEMLTNWTP